MKIKPSAPFRKSEGKIKKLKKKSQGLEKCASMRKINENQENYEDLSVLQRCQHHNVPIVRF